MTLDQNHVDDEAPVNPSSNPTFQSILTARFVKFSVQLDF